MATVVLQAVGSVVGTAIGGPIGGLIGRTAGAIAGSVIDQKLFGPEDRTLVGPRLESARILSSREGAAVPRVYGQARISGEIIWATRFREVQKTETKTSGGKGGGGQKTTVKSFSYYANFAVALCEGEIACIRRIWADGKLLNQRKHTIRIYRGTQDQMPDSLIEAKQGAGNAPAYRGLAYIVFDNLPLENFGNRIPQIAVEVVRPVGELEKGIHAVNMIPASTEFGYDTKLVADRLDRVETRYLNLSQTFGDTDFLASLDELIAICPNLKQISLVVAWFGNDLRAGNCEIYPAVETSKRNLKRGKPWRVAGQSRSQARLVSKNNGSPNYGGTPSDDSVRRAIAAIKSRGLKVCLNPFILMDVPDDNQLPDPYGEPAQGPFPWRGRITCHPAPGQPASADKTQTAADQIAAFIGEASPSEITASGNSVIHESGLSWSYRRMILHYARLANIAGGVDMFLIGSELRGLTTLRDASGGFPFVTELADLAQDVRSILGTGTTITYGADWSEYFGHHPADGSGDVFFHLDELWSHQAIDCVGIDNYMPLADWRSSGDPAEDGRAANDPDMLSANIAGGEGFDWYYASPEDRKDGIRTPITDGLGKPWVYRYKDLHSWWSNPHHNRLGGVEDTQSTAWVPQSKPIVFTEFGCPAIDKGANQPNVFFDPKSSESAIPYFSDGGRDDASMMAYIAAHQRHWDEGRADFVEANNPVSSSTGKRMVDFDASALWAWDARPYPAFPDNSEKWSDAQNWNTGHWLNGRLGSLRVADLIAELLRQSGVLKFDVSQVYEVSAGYVVADIASARDALEIIISLYGLSVFEDRGALVFRSPGKDVVESIDRADTLLVDGEASIVRKKAQIEDLPLSVNLQHTDPANAYQEALTDAQRVNGSTLQQAQLAAPMVIEPYIAQPLLENWLREKWTARETLAFALPPSFANLAIGDRFILASSGLPTDDRAQRWQITRMETGGEIRISAKAVENVTSTSATRDFKRFANTGALEKSAPLVHFLDLPPLARSSETQFNHIAATARPWPGELAVFASPSLQDFSFRQTLANAAFTGSLLNELLPSLVTSRWSSRTQIDVRMFAGQLSSAEDLAVFGGENALAIRSMLGSWEIVQFSEAELIADKTWRLSGLLRGQAGTEIEAAAGAAEGADIVVLNTAVVPLDIAASDRGLELNWQIGPVGSELGGVDYTETVYTSGYRGLLPYQPVHLRVSHSPSGDLVIDWIRRDRLESDDWSLVEVPMSEAEELYQVTLRDGEGLTIERVSGVPALSISSADIEIAFGTQTQVLTVEVSQLSAAVGPGAAAKTTVTINQN